MSEAGEKIYRLIVQREPERVLKRVSRDIAQRLDAAMAKLTTNPRPHGCKRLEGYANLYRIRVGDWRVAYAIEDDKLLILVIEVAPRGGAYRKL